jgi:hypothetical protein
MTPDQIFALFALIVGALLILIGTVIGSWLMYKGKATPTDKSFLGKAPRGECFTIGTDYDQNPLTDFVGEAPEEIKAKKRILSRVNEFLSQTGKEREE